MYPIMDFPQDIWNHIFSYFHSCYRMTSHFKAILNDYNFYMTRKSILCMNRAKYNIYNTYREQITNSFYMQIILFDNTNKSSKYYLTLNRKTACQKILNDFEQIFKEYRRTELQFLRNLTY